ncbi:MAG: hypothetical protein V2I62_00935 [Bacteroidales bacterium]|jgi:hypothetical protein|nr:hypothetical protein [Bacteroidales bacterium]
MKAHSFHIPVMGIGFTIDTPLKVSQYGMDSVISLVDDMLLEKLRKMYCGKYDIPFEEINPKTEDFRAKRITSYLNLIDKLSKKQFEDLKNASLDGGHKLKRFFNMLPENAAIKQAFKKITATNFQPDKIKSWLDDNLSMGSIDVNIMTKIDKENYKDGLKLPIEYNDAHAAIRGFADSNLNASVVLSAGMSPRLYSYLENFDDFYPDINGEIKKKIVLKVSDYKSALIQGKFLAKKGLWVSEYRIESGLNCGGHAFATQGNLLGPILAEFKDQRANLIKQTHDILIQALTKKTSPVPIHEIPIKITVQGGVGTAEEHQFLIDHYQLDSVGWGTPFLLVPEATAVDDFTLNQLIAAREDDLYLSNISPLGVPFNSLKGNTKDLEKLTLIAKGKPGSQCSKKYIALNNEFAEKTMCTASRQYQRLKLQELENEGLPIDEYHEKAQKVLDKSCICVGLGTSALVVNNLDTKKEGAGISICPGPNLAYFSKSMSLKEMTDHIYGRLNVITRNDRPHMFMKELQIYIAYLKTKMEELEISASAKQEQYITTFADNLKAGIFYYQQLFSELKDWFGDSKHQIMQELGSSMRDLHLLMHKTKLPTLPIVYAMNH